MLLFLFVVTSLTSSCQGKSQASGSLDCLNWRVANEANNSIGWTFPPFECIEKIIEYSQGGQYSRDSAFIINEAINYAQNLALPKHGRNIWVFDINDTTLSKLGLLVHHGWMPLKFEMAALPETKRLYKELLSLGIKIVFLTGRDVNHTDSAIANLVAEGFDTWEKLILKSDEFENKTAIEYKSTSRTRLEKGGYRIVSNIGDQWSDISGPNSGMQMFKLPNTLYYIT